MDNEHSSGDYNPTELRPDSFEGTTEEQSKAPESPFRKLYMTITKDNT